MGKKWGIIPHIMKWIYTAMIRPILTYACVSLVCGLNRLYLKKTQKVQRLGCLMISSAFPGTPTGSLEVLLDIPPIDEFILAEAVRGSFRISRAGLWPSKAIGSSQKLESHIDVCNKAREALPLLRMPSDFTQKQKLFKRNFECLIMDRKDAVNLENVPNTNSVKAFTVLMVPKSTIELVPVSM